MTGKKRALGNSGDSPGISPRLTSVNDSCPELIKHLQHEEGAIRKDAYKRILNGELIDRSKAAKILVHEVHEAESHADARASGLVKRVLRELHDTHRMSTELQTFMTTYTPPLSAGGNAGVSAEVQDGMYQNTQQLVQTCSDGLHRMLAYGVNRVDGGFGRPGYSRPACQCTTEKERAMMKLKCLEDKGGTQEERLAVWVRYEEALEENQLHELRKVTALCMANHGPVEPCEEYAIPHLHRAVCVP